MVSEKTVTFDKVKIEEKEEELDHSKVSFQNKHTDRKINNKKVKNNVRYQILYFNDEQLKKLETGVTETLKSSDETISPNGGKLYVAIKRLLDIVLSLLSIIILSPLFVVVSVLIFWEDKGTPFFSQPRLTKNGKPFKMYKFRSMYLDAEERFEEIQKLNETDGLAFKMENDPRVTAIGKFIRKTSIDELPQLINVLLGHMSIIGPRPPLPREVIHYTPYQMNRLVVKGGLSCYCQCSGRSNMGFDEWVDSDIKYIKERSLIVDAKVVAKTCLAVLRQNGAK
ncbi:MAG: sugar transferase [Oscillospiraceae bacterium]|nr:sugar transferase [Oscillospiraceae bacterium]